MVELTTTKHWEVYHWGIRMTVAIRLNGSCTKKYHTRDTAEEEWDRIFPTLEVGEWLEVVEITKEVVTAFGPKTKTN